MRELASNPKFIGSSRLGFSGVLHTWGRGLNFHPHVHFIVPGGALSEDGQQWLPSRADFFVPVKAASAIYRAKFLDCLADSGLADQVRQAAGDKSWIVHCQAVGDGRHALRYLAPYVYRVAISNRRLIRCEPGPDGLGRVTFSYRKSGSRRWRTMTVTCLAWRRVEDSLSATPDASCADTPRRQRKTTLEEAPEPSSSFSIFARGTPTGRPTFPRGLILAPAKPGHPRQHSSRRMQNPLASHASEAAALSRCPPWAP